ncbi:hypothetical protein D3C79_1103860 [compost metagenome]
MKLEVEVADDQNGHDQENDNGDEEIISLAWLGNERWQVIDRRRMNVLRHCDFL